MRSHRHHQPSIPSADMPVIRHTESDMRYITRGVVDVTRTAAVGMVGIGMIGAIGTLIKK